MTEGAAVLLADMVAPSDAASVRALAERIGTVLHDKGLRDFRSPPPEPTTCCGRGCNACVWEGYFAAAQWWREDALARLAKTSN